MAGFHATHPSQFKWPMRLLSVREYDIPLDADWKRMNKMLVSFGGIGLQFTNSFPRRMTNVKSSTMQHILKILTSPIPSFLVM